MENYVITIARGYGSGGKTIGKMLADQLNIPFYDREILYMASEESGINAKLFGERDERVKLGLFDASVKPYKGELIPPESSAFLSDENIFNYRAKIIKDLADKGSCVIIGRCADFILRDRKNVIKTFVWAPYEDCIRNTMEVKAVDRKEAEKRIHTIDKHRGEHYRHYTGQDWDNAKNYDLCINSSDMGFQKSVDIIRAYLDIRLK